MDALEQHYQDRERRRDLRAGVIAAAIGNFSMAKNPDKPPMEPWDFFYSLDELRPELEPMDAAQVLAVFEGRR